MTTQVTFTIHEVLISVRQHRTLLNISEYKVNGSIEDEEKIVIKKIPWRSILLSEAIETIKQSSANHQQQGIIICPSVKVDFLAQCIPAELVAMIHDLKSKTVFCDTCNQELSSSNIEEVILRFKNFRSTGVIALCISVDMLLARDGISWQIAKDFYQVSRVIEDGVLKSSDASTNPQYLVIDTVSLSSIQLDALCQKIDELVQQHGLLTVFDFIQATNDRKTIQHQESLFSRYYCPHCNAFTVAKSRRSREMNISIDDLKNLCNNSTTNIKTIQNKEWIAFLGDPIVQRFLETDTDFKRLLQSLRSFLEDKKDEQVVYIELSNHLWISLAEQIAKLFSENYSNLIFYVAQPKRELKEENYHDGTFADEIVYRFVSDVGFSTLMSFGNIESILINRLIATPYARLNALSSKKFQEAFQSLNSDATEICNECFYLSVNRELLHTATILELSKLLHLDKEICDLLSLLNRIGLGSCTLSQQTSALLEPEKQRLWLCQKILSSKRRRQTMYFVVQDIESDLGSEARIAVHTTIQQLLKKNNVVFKTINETGKELYVRYA